MPTRFLTDEQRRSFGRYTTEPSPGDLARYFHLEEGDLSTINRFRGKHTRLGYALLKCSVFYLGVFPEYSDSIPDTVLSFLRGQLGLGSDVHLGRYFRTRTYERHVQAIRKAHGLTYFGDNHIGRFALTRWLYAACWAGNDRPGTLVIQASAWLVTRNIIVPGVSTLERLVGRVRERVHARLWKMLAADLNPAQRFQISALLDTRPKTNGDETSITDLELLRASPLKRQPTDFFRHLDRVDALREFDFCLAPPKAIPAVQLERLARVARHSKPSAIAALNEPRRTATVAALFYTLEATAQDDATELAEALISDLFRHAETTQTNARISTQREMDKAALLLKDLAILVVGCDDLPLDAWRAAVFETLPRTHIDEAVKKVSSLARPTGARPYTELLGNWRRAKRLFGNIIGRIDLAASPGGQPVLQAMAYLQNTKDWNKSTMRDAPTDAIPKPWRAYVLDGDGTVCDPRAYVFATIEAWHKAVKRRDIFASKGIRYADPRVGLLKGRDWDNAKGTVCRTLGVNLDGNREVTHLTECLHQTFTRVSVNAPDNHDLMFKHTNGKPRISIGKLDRLPEPDSLLALRRQVHALMPKAGIPDILLEVMRTTGFAKAFTHLNERPTKMRGFETSLCAALIAQACNIGFEPLARTDSPALRRRRLSWVSQNFIRPQTLSAASAMIVSVHSQLPITQNWGDGKVASADGMRFLAPKSAIHAGPNPKYFGRGRGVTWYNMISDQYSGLGASVVPGTLRDSLAVLALLLDQETELEPNQIMTDSAAYSDAIFGLFWLLGYKFCPRLADIGGARLWRVDKTANYGTLGAVAEGRVNIKLIIENWEDLIRLAGSLKLGHLKAAGVMRILQVRDKPTTLAKALVQLGRLIKTMHILNYIDDADFRRKILIQLNRQEFRHKLARKIYHGERGEVRNALKYGQEEQLGALGLALNAVVHWNAIYMQEALNNLEAKGVIIDPADIARLSPILWRHINFLGRYEIALPESVERGELRPLRNPTSEWDL